MISSSTTGLAKRAAARAAGGGLSLRLNLNCSRVAMPISISRTAAAVSCFSSVSVTEYCPEKIHNVAIIAHVDHGKTTLVDRLLEMTTMTDKKKSEAETGESERRMDSGDLEKERGITIMSKVTRLNWKGATINVVDTPGHADFGGEVERILSMVNGVVLLVDATEGPMAQTKFVLRKALETGLSPVVVLNKADRQTARLYGEVESDLFDLFDALGANDDQLEYPTMFASAVKGWATGCNDEAIEWNENPGNVHADANMAPLLDMILDQVAPSATSDALEEPFALAVNNVGKDNYLGMLATGRIFSGKIKVGTSCVALQRDSESGAAPNAETSKIGGIFVNVGMERVKLESEYACAGDIVTLAGVSCSVGDTITTAAEGVQAPLKTPPLAPPTLSMNFRANDGPLKGQEGTIVASNKVKERLISETENNVTISLEETGESTTVFGRGELQLGILVEEMRREGFELIIAPPEIVVIDGKEPIEEVTVDVDEEYAGTVMTMLTNDRAGELVTMDSDDSGRTRMVFEIPTRGLLGFQSEVARATHGSAVVTHLFLEMRDHAGDLGSGLAKGKLVSMESGKVTAYALNNVKERGILFVKPGDTVYVGMVVGESNRPDEDIEVNPCKAKHVDNMRSVLKDDRYILPPPVLRNVEEMISYMDADELIEVTPNTVRLRKAELDPNKRRRMRKAKTKKK